MPADETLPTIALIETCYRSRGERAYAPAVVVKSPEPQKILVTGAAGMVGSRLVEMWAAEGRLSQLRCMVRSYHTAARIMRFPVDIVEADLLDASAVRRAVQGTDAIIHLGVGEKAGRETTVLADAAREFKVRRFVHLSSACVYGLGLPAHIEERQEETRLKKTGELYADGKVSAERAVLKAAGAGLPAVMLRPQVVYGPGMRWSLELMQLLARDEVCILEDGGLANLIYIDDLIRAITCALDSNVSDGEAFFISDGNPIRWSRYIAEHARLINRRPRESIAGRGLAAAGRFQELGQGFI